MVILDVAIVNVALPSIRNDLHLTTAGLQWVINAYTLTFAGLLLMGGRAADIFGHRRVFILGMGLFTIASLIGGLATHGTVLIIARAVQGIGGAIVAPATLTILTTTFSDPKERAHAMGIWSACAGAGGASGALLGGVLTELLNWRWIFFLNIPIGIIAAIGAQKLLRSRNERHAKSLDIPGAILVTAGLISIVYGVASAEEHAWISSQTIPFFILGVLLLAAFVLHEGKFASEPLMPLSLWKSRAVASANLVMVFVAMGMFSMWFFVSLALQNVHGFTPMQTGFAFLPMTFGIMLSAQLAPRLMRKYDPRTLVIAGEILAAIGLAWMGQMGVTSSYWQALFVPGILATMGVGLAFTPLTAIAMANVERRFAGLSSGVLMTSRQVGGAFGLAGLATIAAEHTKSLSDTHSIASATMSGYDLALTAGAIAVAIGAVIALTTLPRTRPVVATPEVKAESVELAET